MAVSSINFQKSSEHSYKHNFRSDSPNYLLKEEDRLENSYWENELSAKEIFKNELSKSNRRGGRIPKFENSHWEAVLNLNKEHTLDDVKKVADYLENKLNITCATIAVHRDEGHYKNGKACYNFHAHLTFVTYKDGQQNWRQEKVRNKLSQIQTEIAEILKMERGIDKRESKRQRLEHREYKQKERELKAIKQELEAKDNVIQSQDQAIQDLKDENTELKAKNKLILTQEQIQEIINQALAQKKAEIEQIKQEAKKRESKIIENFYDEIDKMEAEIKEKDKVIKSQNAEIQAKNQELEQEKLSKAELKKELEQLRKDSKNQGFSKEFFQEINLEKKRLRFDNKKEIEQWFQNLVEEHTKKGFLGNKVDNDGIFEEMYKVYKKPYEKIEEKDQEIATLKAELKRSEAKNNEAKNKIQWLENKEKAEKFFDKNTDKIKQNQENDYDDYEHSEQDQEEDQTYNENDDLGIHKILQPRKNK